MVMICFYLRCIGDDSDSDDGSPQSPLGYHGILKFPTSSKKSPTIPRKKVRVTVEDSVPVASFEKVKVTGLNKVKVTGLDQVEVRPQPDSFDVSDMQSLKVQVSSTTTSPKTRIKRRTTTMPVSSSVDEMLAAAKRSCMYNFWMNVVYVPVFLSYYVVFRGFRPVWYISTICLFWDIPFWLKPSICSQLFWTHMSNIS